MRFVMAGGNSSWQAIKLSALLFTALVLFIVFLALYINAVVEDRRIVPAEKTEQNIQPHGRIYPRLPQ